MISREEGVLSKSHYYFFTIPEKVRNLYFYLIWSGHYYCRRGYSIKRESFPHLLLAYVQKGIMNLNYGGEFYRAEEGEILLIDCRQPHHYYSEPGLEFSYFHFDGANSHELCASLLEDNGSPLFRTSANTGIGITMNETITRFMEEETLSSPEISGIIYDIIIRLARSSEPSSGQPHLIERAISYIEEHSTENLALRDIADLVNLSEFYFSRLFKKHTGFSPLDFSLKCKIDRAISLLKTTDCSVGEIAYELGYSTEAAFSTAFKRKTGMPPGKFRRMSI